MIIWLGGILVVLRMVVVRVLCSGGAIVTLLRAI